MEYFGTVFDYKRKQFSVVSSPLGTFERKLHRRLLGYDSVLGGQLTAPLSKPDYG
jgi:hypothetical protein